MADKILLWVCDKCKHTWPKRKEEPTKKCPRCQAPRKFMHSLSDERDDPLAAMTEEERGIIIDLLAVYLGQWPIACRRELDEIVQAYRRLTQPHRTLLNEVEGANESKERMQV